MFVDILFLVNPKRLKVLGCSLKNDMQQVLICTICRGNTQVLHRFSVVVCLQLLCCCGTPQVLHQFSVVVYCVLLREIPKFFITALGFLILVLISWPFSLDFPWLSIAL